MDVGTSERATVLGRNSHSLTLTGSGYVKAICVRQGEQPSAVSRSMRFAVRCPPPKVLYDLKKHPEGGVSGGEMEMLCALRSTVSGAVVLYSLRDESHDSKALGEDDIMDLPALGSAERGMNKWGESVSVCPQDGAKIKKRQTLTCVCVRKGMDDSVLVRVTHALNGSAIIKQIGAPTTSTRTAATLIVNHKGEILVTQPRSRQAALSTLDAFLWAEVRRGEDPQEVAEKKVKNLLKLDAVRMSELVCMDVDGAGLLVVYRCTVRVGPVRVLSIAQESGMLHAQFVAPYELLCMLKGSVGDAELREMAELLLLDSVGVVPTLLKMEACDAFVKDQRNR